MTSYLSVFILEVYDFILLNIVLVVIVFLQRRYFHRHMNSLSSRKQKRDVLIQTIVFSVAITYRAVINGLKLGYSASVDLSDPNDPNPVEDLES
jgi:hypothetical protein